ncbi:MAG: hypothetical protein GX803_07240 [Lentisphaerae bacterium]|jgi:hypothetical protein|nr:hypothetical protein [Lentisphaerota bacterium]
MRILSVICGIVLTVQFVYGGVSDATFTVLVKDEAHLPVTNATVGANFMRSKPIGSGAGSETHQHITGQTDTNGLYVFHGACNGVVYWSATKDGYYKTYALPVAFSNSIAGRWLPWNNTYETVLRKIEHPIPMYAKKLRPREFYIPATNSPVGYDFVKGDWVAPYGLGETPDFIFILDCVLGETRKSGIQMYNATLSLSFSNEDDGIQEVIDNPRTEGSVYRLPRYAPENGYMSNWKSSTSADLKSVNCEYAEDQNFFFRVRTKKDMDGRIISANYGKIRGPLFYEVLSRGTSLQMIYYFNPNPNDRNMEYDPKRNMSENLRTGERVNEP